MSKLNLIRKCASCGAILQCDNPNEKGFVEKIILESNPRVNLCKKCYEKESYELVPNTFVIDSSLRTMLEDAKATDALIVYLIDLFSFEASFSDEVNKSLTSRNVLVVGNKRDLLPKNLDNEIIKKDVIHRFRREKIKIADVVLVSSTTEENIEYLIETINKLRRGHDVYLLGCDKSGKTYLLNSILKNYTNKTRRPIKTMEYPGTSTNVLQIPLDKNSTLFDTVPLKSNNSIIYFVEDDLLRSIIPTTEVKIDSFRMSEETLFIGTLARIEFLNNYNTTIKTYFSVRVEFKKVSNKKADAKFKEFLEKKKLCPSSNKIRKLEDFNTYEILITENEDRDIGIQGLGWVSFKGNNQKIRVHVPKGVAIYSCRAKIPNA